MPSIFYFSSKNKNMASSPLVRKMITDVQIQIGVLLSLIITEAVLVWRMNKLIKALKDAKEPLQNIMHFFNMTELHLKKFRSYAEEGLHIKGENEKLGKFEFKVEGREK